jgi:hypothetical protein
VTGQLQQGDQQGHVHAGFDAQLTIARASLAVAGAAAARLWPALSQQLANRSRELFLVQ